MADPGGGKAIWTPTYEDQEFTGAYTADPGGGKAVWGYSADSQRALQRAAIANGTVIFYWPFDEQDMSVTNAIRVVTANERGAVGTDYSAPLATLTGTITPSWSDYAMRLNTAYLELSAGPPTSTPEEDAAGDMARRLVAGRRAVASSASGAPVAMFLNDTVSECYDYYQIDPRTYAYLFVFQYVKETGINPQFLWDLYGSVGFSSRVDDNADSARFKYPSGTDADNLTLPAASAATNGEVRTVGWYYDGTANLIYTFRGTGSGDTVTWSAGTTQNVAGGVPVQDISGISSPVGKVQGCYAIEFTTPPLIATVQTAVDQTRANWKAGTKVLPAALLA